MNQRNEFEKLLIEKAMKDKSFRKQLIKDPNAAIEAETGIKIPEKMKIEVLEEDPKTVYLILPQVFSQETELELTEYELENVSGGFSRGGGCQTPHHPTMWPEC
jgi:hypothetical protein